MRRELPGRMESSALIVSTVTSATAKMSSFLLRGDPAWSPWSEGQPYVSSSGWGSGSCSVIHPFARGFMKWLSLAQLPSPSKGSDTRPAGLPGS